MTLDELIRLAESVGLVDVDMRLLARFATAVGNAECEECAKICEAQGAYRDEIDMALECAWAIRLRVDAA